jgi:tetratricopeptide (TPR) repeat protein
VLAWAREQDAGSGLRLCAAIWRYWESHNLIGEGRAWLESFVGLAPAITAVRGKALVATAALSVYQGDFAAARRHAEEGLSVFRRLGDKAGVAKALNELGLLACYEGDYPAAGRLLEESLEIKRESGSPYAIAGTINNLGLLAGYEDDFQAAYALHAESLAMYRGLEEKSGVAMACGNLGHDALRLGRLDEARARQAESLCLFNEIGDKDGIAECFERLAMLANAEGDFRCAARWFGVAAVLRSEAGTLQGLAGEQEYESELNTTRSQLDVAAFDTAWTEGRGMNLAAAVAQAVAKC